jgi:Exostosin family
MLKVHLEQSCGSGLKSIFVEGTAKYFQLVDDPALADIIVFEADNWPYLRRSALIRQYRDKCICISEWDKPSFFLPSISASNKSSWYSSGRAETMHYPLAARGGWNEWVTWLANEPADKKYLYSFMGKSSSRVRKVILRHYATSRLPALHDDILIEGSDHAVLNQAGYRDASMRRYAEIMSASKFALCPRGWGTSSLRLFEACEMGVAPVILADRWVPIGGIDWSFALFVGENRVRDLDGIIRSHESEWVQRGQRARQTFLENFGVEVAPRTLMAAIARLIGSVDPHREAAFRRWYPLIHLGRIANERLSKWIPSYRA